jgi:hypothetical protein
VSLLEVVKEADEAFERHYEMKRLGYDLNMVEGRACSKGTRTPFSLESGRREKQMQMQRPVLLPVG